MGSMDGGILTDHVVDFPLMEGLVIKEVGGGVISQSVDFDDCGVFRLSLRPL